MLAITAVFCSFMVCYSNCTIFFGSSRKDGSCKIGFVGATVLVVVSPLEILMTSK